jgi:CDP-6-deoxy-D-xylo-4-hexulose-3-dehydrase
VSREQQLRDQIFALVREFAAEAHSPQPFLPGKTHIPVSGKVFGGAELESLVDASLDFWLTTGRFNEAFERKLARFLGVRHALTANSGSSANLLALASLTSPKLGARALKPGDEVITVATGFPTTINPILLYGLVPVFIDVHIPTYNVCSELIEDAISPRTRAIVMAHTLGNPFDLKTVMEIAKRHDLWVIEDCCDALGSTYREQLVGTFGNIGTLSFYPAHHITMGEGGAVFTNQVALKPIIESFRDWGRDCWCAPGKENTCGKRFCWQLGSLPEGYDHKYIYSHVGYNLKITDMQAAVGLAQMERLPGFIDARRRNFRLLYEKLRPLQEFLILPEATAGSDPSWFGFPVTVRESSPVSRLQLIRHLDHAKVGTRLLFGGNLVRQPMMESRNYRIAGELNNSDLVMNNTFWLGVYPGITEEMIDYMVEQIAAAFAATAKACV